MGKLRRGVITLVFCGLVFVLAACISEEGSLDTIDEPVDLRIDFNIVGDMISIRGKEYYRVSTASLEALATSQAP